MAMDLGTLVAYLELEDSKFRDSLGKMPGWMAAAGAAAAVALAAAFAASLAAAINMEAAQDKIAAQLGLTEVEAERAGDAAAGAYANAFGSSLEAVQATTAGVVGSIAGMRDASVEELQGIVEGVQTIADGFEIEADRISQVVGQMISTGMADSAQEGLDLLTAALQKVPPAVREDILDATDEYGPFFAGIGMSGEEAMSALVRASEKGMYGIDKTGDAVKEFGIRATDMSATSVAAYEAAGLNAEDMAAKILAGGDTAAEGFQQIVDGLLGIEDPTARANAAIGLFGTPLEDLGVNEIPAFLQSLSDMESGLGDVAGATSDMASTMGGNIATTWDGIMRKVEIFGAEIGEKFLPLVEPALAAVAGGFEAISPFVMDLATVLADLASNAEIMVPILSGLAAGILYLLAPSLWAAVTATWAWTAALLANPVTWIVLGIMALVAAIVFLAMNWEEVTAWISEVWSGFMTWITEVIDGFVAWWNGVWEGFASWIGEIWIGITSFIEGVWQGFLDWIQGVIDGFVQWVGENWGLLLSFLIGPIGLAIQWVVENWGSIVAWFQNMLSEFLAFWNSIWTNVGSFLRDTWNGAVTFIQGIPGAIMNVFTGAATWLYNIGRDIVQGLWNGLKSIWSSVAGWFEDTFGGIIDTVAGIFQINSPSRVFREIGEFVGQGFVDGLDRMTPEIDQATMDAFGGVPGTAQEGLQGAAGGSGGAGTTFHYHAAENQSLSEEEALYAALGSPRSPFGGVATA